MAKVNFRNKWKKIVAITLAVLTSAAAVFGIVKLAQTLSSDTKEISPSFTRGALSVDGKFQETNTSIVTEESFECEGLKITPDFTSNVTYQVFYYDQENKFVESTDIFSETYTMINVDAKYARVVIYPQETEDGEPVKVKWHQVRKYRKQLTIEVNREQKYKIRNLYEIGMRDARYQNDGGNYNTDNIVTGSSWYTVKPIDIGNYKEFEVILPSMLALQNNTLCVTWIYEDNKITYQYPDLVVDETKDTLSVIIPVNSNAKSFTLNLYDTTCTYPDIEIYGHR